MALYYAFDKHYLLDAPHPRFFSVIIVIMPYIIHRTQADSFKVMDVEGDGLWYTSDPYAIHPNS